MKQGTTFTMSVKFDGVDVLDIETVEFLFKTEKSKTSKAVKQSLYPGDAVLDSDGKTFLIPWSRKETYEFNGQFFMDTRISLKTGQGNPETPIVTLVMAPTLFGEGE